MNYNNNKNLLEEYHQVLNNGDMEDLEEYVNKKYNLKADIHQIKKPSLIILLIYNALNYFLIFTNFVLSITLFIDSFENFMVGRSLDGSISLGLFAFFDLIIVSNIVRIYSVKKYKPLFITLVANLLIFTAMYCILSIIRY